MEVAENTSFWKQNELTIKGIIIGALILILLVPTLFIDSLVQERAKRRDEVISEVNSKWAGKQVITGPLIMVPYLQFTPDNNPKNTPVRNWAYFLPDRLAINGSVDPIERYRSIFKIILYHTNLNLEGEFSPVLPAGENIRWLPQEARFCFGISDFRGIEESMQLSCNGESLSLNAGVPDPSILQNGLSAPLSLDSNNAGKPIHFSLQFKLKGSENLSFVPVGKTTEVNLKSVWDNPAFNGSFLPETKQVNEMGFTASWKILYLNRNYPQLWRNEKYDLSESSFGVDLLQSPDGYAKTRRSVKYAILFIGLTFTIYFFIEILQRKRIHPLQYILVGLALCVFYTLLLSISEYLGFNLAYLIAALATVCLIGSYTHSLFHKLRVTLLFGTAIASLYGFIFVLIQLQDGALLIGSIGLFTILGIVMYYSRKIDWYLQPGSAKTGLTI